MRLAIVSDVHLRDPRSARQHAFVSFLDELEADHLVLLGDIFHSWSGQRATPPAAVAPVCAAFMRLRQRGLPVTFLRGNHELQAGSYLQETLGWSVKGVHLHQLWGAPLLLAHGDEADRRPLYRTLSWALRSHGFEWLMDALPEARAESFLAGLAGSGDAVDARDPVLVAAQRRWAGAHLRRGAAAVVLGHSHVAGLHDLPDGLVVHTGAWAGLRTWVSVVPGRLSLLRRAAGGADEVLDARAWPPVVP